MLVHVMMFSLQLFLAKNNEPAIFLPFHQPKRIKKYLSTLSIRKGTFAKCYRKINLKSEYFFLNKLCQHNYNFKIFSPGMIQQNW